MNIFLQTKTLPKILFFSEIKYYLFSLIFTGLAVFVPWFLHKFQLAGPQFLPIHYFIIIAGFLFGWRVGIFTAIFSPLFSYYLTHLPPLIILPEVVLELVVYGFLISFLRKRNFKIFPALILTMMSGRLARVLFVLALGLNTNPLKYFEMSLQGMALQIVLIPIIIICVQKYIFKKENEGEI